MKSLGSKPRTKVVATSEETKAKPKTGLFTSKPSAKLTSIKTADPFSSSKKHKTNFGYVYSAGGIPCRILHGSITNKLQWSTQPEALAYDPLLITCFEGLQEVDHPYNFVALQAIKTMLTVQGSQEKATPLVSRLFPSLRGALLSSNEKVFLASNQALKQLVQSQISGNLYKRGDIATITSAVICSEQKDELEVRKLIVRVTIKEKVIQTLNTIEEYAGPETKKIIKTKIPTYSSLY